MRSTVWWFSLVAALAACSVFDLDAEFRHAAAMFTCGPADGPATSILLAQDPIESPQPPFPVVQVIFWEAVSALAGRTWDIAGDLAPTVTYHRRRGDSSPATSGRVTVASVDSTKQVIGNVDVQFGSRTIATDFSAHWIESGRVCP